VWSFYKFYKLYILKILQKWNVMIVRLLCVCPVLFTHYDLSTSDWFRGFPQVSKPLVHMIYHYLALIHWHSLVSISVTVYWYLGTVDISYRMVKAVCLVGIHTVYKNDFWIVHIETALVMLSSCLALHSAFGLESGDVPLLLLLIKSYGVSKFQQFLLYTLKSKCFLLF
jgi:hypothetical protein